MYPLTDETLTLWEIAENWSRELPQHPHLHKVLETLIGAMWTDELSIQWDDRWGREELLRYVRRLNHPGICFYEDSAALPPLLATDQQGNEYGLIRTDILLLSDPERWTEESKSIAFVALTGCEFEDYHESARLILSQLTVTRDDFAAFCAARRYALPLFWFHRNAKPSSAKAQSDFRRWLKELIKGPKLHSKPDYCAEALSRFPGLSKQAFTRVWGETVPKEWSKAGRSRKSQR